MNRAIMIGSMIVLILAFNLTTAHSSFVIDSFDDGDFTSNPVWLGDTGSWKIISNSTAGPNATGSNTLRLDAPGAGPTYLSTQITTWGDEQSWGFWAGRRSGSSITSSNHCVVWIYANEQDLESATVDGYRVMIGDSSNNAEITLQKMTDGTSTDLIATSGGALDGRKDFGVLIRVTRTAQSVWTLYTSALPTADGGGASADLIPSADNTAISHGTATDASYTSFNNGYYGVVAVHTFGATKRDRAEFDQLYFDQNSDSSLPVQLSEFDAIAEKDQIKIAWKTESEIDNLGFWIYRSTEFDGEYQKINPAIVRGAGNSAKWHFYKFQDTEIEIGKRYFYFLEDLAFDGTTSRSEIISAVVGFSAKDKMLTHWANLKKLN